LGYVTKSFTVPTIKNVSLISLNYIKTKLTAASFFSNVTKSVVYKRLGSKILNYEAHDPTGASKVPIYDSGTFFSNFTTFSKFTI